MQFTYPRRGGAKQRPQIDRRIIPESVQGAGKGKVSCGEGLCGWEKWWDVAREAKIPVLFSFCLNSTYVLRGIYTTQVERKPCIKPTYVTSDVLVLVEVAEVRAQALVQVKARPHPQAFCVYSEYFIPFLLAIFAVMLCGIRFLQHMPSRNAHTDTHTHLQAIFAAWED